MNRLLKWDVFVSPQIPAVTGDLPPGATEMKWSPISSTLISGERDAVLVDTFITIEQTRAHRMGRRKWKESDCHLCDAWPWRSFLWRQHDSTALSRRPVCGFARCNLGNARSGFGARS